MPNEFNSAEAIRHSTRDNAGSGYCGRGTYNILKHMGLPATNGNGCDWDDSLPENGWIKVKGLTPETAPPGAVIVYENDAAMGKANRGTGGGSYGHVEVVAEIDGTRRYVSDAARSNYGGTVPDNFEGVYIHPSMMTAAQAREYGVNATKSDSGSWQYAQSKDPVPEEQFNAAAFDGMNLGEMMKMISAIFTMLFQGFTSGEARHLWSSPDKEIGEHIEPDNEEFDLDDETEIGKPVASMDNHSTVSDEASLKAPSPDVKVSL